MARKNQRRVGPNRAEAAESETLNAAPSHPEVPATEDEEPLSHLRKRVLQPIRARIYARVNRRVDRLGYVSAVFLLLAFTAVSFVAITFWNNPEKATKTIVVARYYFAARHRTSTHFKDAQAIISELTSQLTADSSTLNREREDLGYTTWTEAQIALALQGNGLLDEGDLAQWFQQQVGSCHCWRGHRSDHENVATTAWVLLALARMQVKPAPEEIEFLLDNQHRSGWWQFYHSSDAPSSVTVEDPRNASTYATAFCLLALQELLERRLFPESQEQQMRDAIARGRNWLLSNTIPGEPGRWKDYPNGEDGLISVGISGIALHTVHRTPGPAPSANDSDWMAQLPAILPQANDVSISGQPVQITKNDSTRDATHMFAIPWLMVGTRGAYSQGTLAQRAQALRLFSEVPLQQDGIRAEVQGKPWAAAEFLIGLRYLRGEDVL